MSAEFLTANREDACRDAIIKFLYHHQKKSRGMRASGLLFTKIRSAMKDLGYKQPEVVAALNYLKDTEWITEETRSRQYRTPQGTVRENERTTYRISAAGVARVEGASVFEPAATKFTGINISQVVGVVSVGDGNVVNAQVTDVARSVEALASAVEKSAEISETEKLSASADLLALRAQLAKPEPTKPVVQQIWESLKFLADVHSVAALFMLVEHGLRTAGWM